MESVLNHIAVVVDNIEKVLIHTQFDHTFIGEIETFPAEGTRELYIGSDVQMGRLLLMQAIGTGPYQRAFEKRGSHFHHIALDVINLDEFVLNLVGSGWLLHPVSLSFYKQQRQVYLCRPGTPILIELQEKDILIDTDYFIDKMEFPFAESRLLDSLNCQYLGMKDKANFKIGNMNFSLKDLVDGTLSNEK